MNRPLGGVSARRWRSDVAQAGVAGVWRALGLRAGVDPHRGVVGRKFRLLGRCVIHIGPGGETSYLSAVGLLIYAVLGELRGTNLSAAAWQQVHAAAYAAGLTTDAPEDLHLDLTPWSRRYARMAHEAPPAREVRPALPAEELDALWGQRSSLLARPALAAALAAWAAPRRLDVAAIERLTESGEAAIFAADALRSAPRWLPVTMRGRDALAVPTWTLEGVRANLCARALSGDGPKSARATGVRASGQLYANATGRAVLAGRRSATIVVAEGETDWLLWACARPDLAVLGVFSGSITDALGERLAAALSRDCRLALRTDRDDAGEAYARKLIGAIRRAGGDLSAVLRAQGTGDDGDLHVAGTLDLSDPLAGCQPLDAVDPNTPEPWAGLPVVPLAALRGPTGHIARDLRTALTHTDAATVLSYSTGAGKTHSLIELLAGEAPEGVTVVAVQSRMAVVALVGALKAAGVAVTRFLGRDGPQEDRQERIHDAMLGATLGEQVITCVNASVLSRVRRGLDARIGCGTCPFAARCEQPRDPERTGTRGDIRAVREALSGVTVCTHQGLSAVLHLVDKRLGSVIIDELPDGDRHVLEPRDLAELTSHGLSLDLLAAQPENHSLIDPLRQLADATDALLAHLQRELTIPRGQAGTTIRLPHDPPALQAVAAAWLAALDAPALSRLTAARFPNLRVSALRALQALAADGTAGDVVLSAEAKTGTLVVQQPFAIPANVPVVGLDATPVAGRWESVTGRPVRLRGARLPRHVGERGLTIDSAYHSPAPWSERERRLARAELEEVAMRIGPELSAVRRERDAEEPLALLVGWQRHLPDIDAIIGSDLRRQGFRVRLTHWYSADFRGSNAFSGAAAVLLFGLPRANGDAQRMNARALCRVRGEVLPASSSDVDWEAVQREALAAMTQAAGRARSTVDPEQRRTLFVSLAPVHPEVVAGLVARGQGAALGALHGNDQTLSRLVQAGLGWVGGLLALPERTPGLSDAHRPSRSGIQRVVKRLRALSAESVTIPLPGRGRPVVFYRVPGTTQSIEACLRQLEAIAELVGLQRMNAENDLTPGGSMSICSECEGEMQAEGDEVAEGLSLLTGSMVSIEGVPAVIDSIFVDGETVAEAWPARLRRLVPAGWAEESHPLGALEPLTAAMWARWRGLPVEAGGSAGRIVGVEGERVLVRLKRSGLTIGVMPDRVRPRGAGPAPDPWRGSDVDAVRRWVDEDG